MAARWHDPDGPQVSARPAQIEQDLHATLEGNTLARRDLVARVARREGPHLQHRGALSDGAEARPQPLLTHLPLPTLVLEIIHATAYRWDTANALRGETPPHGTVWVRHALEPRVAGQADAVITALEEAANAPSWTAAQRQAVQCTVGYDRRHRPYLRDDESLAQGWPMGTGVIEGACRPLVNDRLAPSGRRWTKAGAHAGLNRRAVRLNAHGDRSWPCHRPQPPRYRYGSSAPVPEGWESQALPWAA